MPSDFTVSRCSTYFVNKNATEGVRNKQKKAQVLMSYFYLILF
jgi:hypothetical protein